MLMARANAFRANAHTDHSLAATTNMLNDNDNGENSLERGEIARKVTAKKENVRHARPALALPTLPMIGPRERERERKMSKNIYSNGETG